MGTFFVYILKASFCLGSFYLFYRWLLTRDTFHRFNRIALLCILLLSLFLPFCQVTTHTYTEVQQTMLSWEQLLMMANFTEAAPIAVPEQVTTLRWLHMVLILYAMGVLFFVGRHVYSIGNLFSLIWQSRKETLPGGIRLIIHQQEIAPFSWMRYIVISEKDLEECGRETLAHETAHIKKLHSLDLLLADCCIFFQWFNPASWLLKQELQSIHEYEADEEVLRQGIDAKTYQLLLIKKAVGTRLYSMANSFNHSNLKKRITMMLKEKSSPWARMKCLYVIPVAAIAVTAFARPEVTSVAEEISAVKVSDLSALVETNSGETSIVEESAVNIPVSEMSEPSIGTLQTSVAPDSIAPGKETVVLDITEEMPEFPGGMSEFMTYIMKHRVYPPVARDAGIQGRVIVQFVVEKDGSVSSPTVVRSIHPLLDEEALRLIRNSPSWKPGKQNGKPVAVRYTVAIAFQSDELPRTDPYQEEEVVRYSSFNNEDSEAKPLLVVDGEIVSYNILKALDVRAIESIEVLKEQSSVAKYGEEGKNGAIEITLKGIEGKSRNYPAEIELRVEGSGNQLTGVPASIESAEGAKPTAEYPMKVSGQVVDESGKPIAGALINTKGSQTGTITNMDGQFLFYAPQNAVIEVKYIDMATVEVRGGTDLKISLKAE